MKLIGFHHRLPSGSVIFREMVEKKAGERKGAGAEACTFEAEPIGYGGDPSVLGSEGATLAFLGKDGGSRRDARREEQSRGCEGEKGIDHGLRLADPHSLSKSHKHKN
jgi:hypothetical protein